MKSFIQFLREYNRDITLQRMGDQLKAAAARDRNQTPAQVLATFEDIDPTRNKQYIMWLIREYGKQRFKLEDKPRLNTLLKNFERVKSRIQQKDINRYTLHELERTVDAIVDPTLGQLQTNAPFVIPDDIKDDVKVLYNGPLGVLTIPKTKKASCELGRGTKWCTAAQRNNMFDEYNKKGPLYIWRDKNGEKYQFHFKTRQFMDARDEPITTETLNQFRTSHSVLKKLFQREEAKIATNPERAYQYARYVIKGRFPEAEAAIAKNPKMTFYYADDILMSRFPEGEAAMATNPYWAYHYAHHVIKGRWPEAEAVIATDPEWAYEYALNVIKGRWPEGEAAIAKDPEWAYEYALNVIKGRWPEGEAAIAKDPQRACFYAFNVIKGRWPEGEAAIATHPRWAYRYAEDIIKGRWPEGEAAIAKGGYKQQYQKFLARL